MPLRGDWSYPTSVRFGAGRIAELADATRAAGMARPLFVTDPKLAATATAKRALGLLDAAGIPASLFADVRPNPVEANVRAGVAAFRAGGHDGIVALPTTAGTGSEVGRAAVVTDEAIQTKKIIYHPRMLPKIAICDPELTLGMPPMLTAGTGMDAFSHCLEAYCVPSYHPLADGIAIEGMRLVRDNLARAVKDGGDIEARANMMAAAVAGATAFQKGLGAIHALSHPVGALHDNHHGLTNAVFAPYVLAFNRKAIEAKIRRLAAYLGLEPSFRAFLDWVLALRAEIGIPHTLAGLDVDDRNIDRIVAMAPNDPTAGGNPVLFDKRAARTIFKRALEGRL